MANTDVRLTLGNLSVNPPPFLVVFASGDDGLLGVSKAVLQHLADRASGRRVQFADLRPRRRQVRRESNYAAARGAFSSIVVRRNTRSLARADAARRRRLSRGAGVVIASAGDPTLKTGIVGALAIALTREFDDLTIPDNEQLPNVKMDSRAAPDLSGGRAAGVDPTCDHPVDERQLRAVGQSHPPTQARHADSPPV